MLALLLSAVASGTLLLVCVRTGVHHLSVMCGHDSWSDPICEAYLESVREREEGREGGAHACGEPEERAGAAGKARGLPSPPAGEAAALLAKSGRVRMGGGGAAVAGSGSRGGAGARAGGRVAVADCSASNSMMV